MELTETGVSVMPSDTVKRFRALVADDAPWLLEILSEFLETLGPIDVVGTARNGREAVEQVEALDPDLLLLDYEMPELTGLDALLILRHRHPRLRIIMITVYETVEVRETCLAHGADAFLAKARVFDELPGEIQRWLGLVAKDGDSQP